MLVDGRLTDATVELLQSMIRNACVNDGRPESGQEVRNAEVLASFLEGPGIELEVVEPIPGRRSVIGRIEGNDPDAPSLALVGHTDVVPASHDDWRHDPFAGELIDGEVWGRGAVDMLNLTASMAVAVRQLARGAFRPRGTLIFLGVADEECGGRWGAEWLCANRWEDIACDYVLTEAGGMAGDLGGGPRLFFDAAEKGSAWRRLRVHGTAGHGSAPYGVDNAILKAAEVIRRLHAAPPRIVVTEDWPEMARAFGVEEEVYGDLVDPDRVVDALGRLDTFHARVAHAMTHMTVSCNVIHGGQKTNTIPDVVEIDVDIRLLPGQSPGDADEVIAEALGDLSGSVDIEPLGRDRPATRSPTDTPVWRTITELGRQVHPDAVPLAEMNAGGTDAPHFRDRGAVVYGAGLFSSRTDVEDFSSRFHGPNERIDVESLGLSAAFWREVAQRTIG